MTRLIKRDRGNYTNISNILARDSRLSWKARGIFLYLWSQADSWEFKVSEVAKHAKDGRDSLRSGLKELRKYGYLTQVARHIKATGKLDGWDWILDDKPERRENINNQGKASDCKDYGNNEVRYLCGTETPEQLRNNNNKNYQLKEITSKRNNSERGSLTVSKLKKEFERLWSQYPKKAGKKQAFNHYKSWRKEAPKKNTYSYLENRLNIYKAYIQQHRIKPQYILNGSTWFNGRFEDDLGITNAHSDPNNGFDQGMMATAAGLQKELEEAQAAKRIKKR